MSDSAREKLIAELQAVPKPERLTWLAALPEQQQRAYKQILPAADVRKLNDTIIRLRQKPKVMSREVWITEARAGRATSEDAMIEVLREVADKLRPRDAQWISRIESSVAGRSFSRKQAAVIRGIYERYFDQAADAGAPE